MNMCPTYFGHLVLGALLQCVLLSGHARAAGLQWDAAVGIAAGVRTDQLQWSIAGTPVGENPNILSELEWRDLEIHQVQANAHLLLTHDVDLWPQTLLQVDYGYGTIRDGKNIDSDYASDDRTDQNALIVSDAGDGHVYDLSVGFGPRYLFSDNHLAISPRIGYSRHQQNLKLFAGQQLLPRQQLLTGLDSSYDTEWKGPWAGVEIVYIAGNQWQLTANFEYHRVDYAAVAEWNLRDDFRQPRSFEHRADGRGVVAGLAWNYALSQKWSVGIQVNFQRWQTEHGVDRLFLNNGVVLPTRLNRVEWHSTAINAGLSYCFSGR